MSDVLIVDDEPAICWAIREALTDDGHTVRVCPSAEESLRLTSRGFRPDVVVMDVRLPGIDGLSAIREMRKQIGETPVVVMTAFGSLDTAVRAIEEGAFDYLVKPFDLDVAVTVLKRALASRTEVPSSVTTGIPDSAEPEAAIIGSSAAMQQVFKQIALVAASDVGVLITGESGTGKELVARAIHRHSRRKLGPFLPVCIPALNSGLIESELFGHARGAFTGAGDDRTGLLELAAKGTVLLDEIADVSLSLQVKLLRALEQREILPVGGTAPRELDVRIIAATNRSLPELVSQGAFREDLYFRLGVFQIHLPPLRERPDDIQLLAEHFLKRIAPPRPGTAWQLAPETIVALRTRAWTGNVRELRNAIEHAAIVARGGEILPDHLPAPAAIAIQGQGVLPVDSRVQREIQSWTNETAPALAEAIDPQLYERFLQLVEPPLLSAVLEHCQGNRAAAAQLLGLHRATLRQKLRRHGIAE
ncbi:MAG: sigma-54-dependent Fis family transcriptional regulator [Planctomycetes bacterium]|nr:sigma-54-dependent Fis family transcriptional regulator [Planctomycetota bacterium]